MTVLVPCQSWGRNVPQGGPFRPKCPSCALTHAGCMGAPLCALLLPCPGRGQAPSAHRKSFLAEFKKKKLSPTGFVLVANHTPNDQRTTTARIIFVVNALRSAPKSRAASSGDRPDSRRPCARTPALLECNWAVLETPPLAQF